MCWRHQRLVRFRDRSPSDPPLPIYSAASDEPIEPSWMTIAAWPETDESLEGAVLYFLSDSGDVLEVLQYETLQIALDQAKAITGVAQDEWGVCDVPVPEDGVIKRSLL